MTDLERTIDKLIQKRFAALFGRKTLDAGTYGGPLRIDKNGQVVAALRGGPEYGFAQRTIAGFGEKIGFVIPFSVARRFRADGFALHACIPPDVETDDPEFRAGFDIQLAPTGTPDGAGWTSIFTLGEGETPLFIQGAALTLVGGDTQLKTANVFYSSLLIDIPNQMADSTVYILAGWSMRCVLIKVDSEDDDGAYGNLADLVFKVVLDPIE